MNSSENLKGTTASSGGGGGGEDSAVIRRVKPPFKPAKDDTKPVLQDPILRSDPIETEEAVLMLPPIRPKSSSIPR
ncbi:unnamed protein product [Rhodiola kirilowii]